MTYQPNQAPGGPGIDPTWSSSAKDMVSTALGSSRLWATFGYGIVNEVYWPSTGQPQIRDLGFIIAGRNGWTEVKRAQRYSISMPKPYIPLPRIVHRGDDYRLELEFLVHPHRDALLIRYKLDGDDLKLYALLSPHLNGERHENTAWAGDDLSAQHGDVALCLRNDGGFTRTSAGYVGTSDGWQDFDKNGKMAWTYPEAGDGNVALMGELAANSGILALGLAETVEGARTLARSSLADEYDDIVRIFCEQWEDWGKTLDIPHASPELKREAELSAAIIKIHEDRTYGGAMVASLSVPWGSSRDDLGGYHLVWTRDAVEAAFAMIAVGQLADAARTLAYLVGTQAADGSWAQNYFPDGRGYWTGNQLDEVALPVLLMAKLRAVGHLSVSPAIEAMVRKAVSFIVRNGPMTDQDRWEENAGASPFTLAMTICALVAAADLLDPEERDYVLSLADCWNERIENWTYATAGPLSAEHGVDGYYVRIAPRDAQNGLRGSIDVRNVTEGRVAANDLVGMEFLCLVRSGLRSPNDPRILNTLKIVDTLLRRDTPSGPSYYRYNGDGYGEHADGSAFDGDGIGRLWPLLTGERGHFAVAAGEDALPYLDAMSHMTGPGGLIPEQIWDTDAIPARGLEPGKPSGSAMPLLWAHAEFLKLLSAQADGRPSESLAIIDERYGGKRPSAAEWHWRENSPFDTMPAGRTLLIERPAPFALRYGFDGAATTEAQSAPGPLGLHAVRFAPDKLPAGAKLSFAFEQSGADTAPMTITIAADA
ncbi:MAG: glycoside hydrolase family 15 protein [Devosia sp.]